MCGSKNDHLKNMCLKDIELCAPILLIIQDLMNNIIEERYMII